MESLVCVAILAAFVGDALWTGSVSSGIELAAAGAIGIPAALVAATRAATYESIRPPLAGLAAAVTVTAALAVRSTWRADIFAFGCGVGCVVLVRVVRRMMAANRNLPRETIRMPDFGGPKGKTPGR